MLFVIAYVTTQAMQTDEAVLMSELAGTQPMLTVFISIYLINTYSIIYPLMNYSPNAMKQGSGTQTTLLATYS